jgi:uncharacterized protein (TIGR03435 family)
MRTRTRATLLLLTVVAIPEVLTQAPAPQPAESGATPAPDASPSVFTAVQEQLGLKLESSRAEREVLVIDRLERPSENP